MNEIFHKGTREDSQPKVNATCLILYVAILIIALIFVKFGVLSVARRFLDLPPLRGPARRTIGPILLVPNIS